MFKRIIVPLDGSARAEHAIPVAARIARASDASLVFVRATTIPIEYRRYVVSPAILPDVKQEAIEGELDEVEHYLRTAATSDQLVGIHIDTKVLVGPAAPEILSAAESFQADLLVMCSHGYTGFKRWALGSVAQKVARHSPVPVLVLHEEGGALTNLHPGGIRPVRVLVALDGSSLAEATLVPAARLSVVLSAPAQGALHLARVLPFPPVEDVTRSESVTKTREMAIAETKAYLKSVEQCLREGDLAHLDLLVTSSVAVRTDPADTLIGMAENGEYMDDLAGFNGCDVIAMATHGRGGLQRWVLGSVTERVLGATKLPLLIVRPPAIM
jgi:nucleotide-binding universal stress UspA family protein